MKDFNSISAAQGWDRDSQIAVLLSFVSAQGLDQALTEHARAVAAEENAGSDWDSPVSGR